MSSCFKDRPVKTSIEYSIEVHIDDEAEINNRDLRAAVVGWSRVCCETVQRGK